MRLVLCSFPYIRRNVDNMITDKFGNELNVGDYLIVTVSKGSHYLTTARILGLDEGSEKSAYVEYFSTVKTKWINPSEEATLKYKPKPVELTSELGLFRDGVGRPVMLGDGVAYKCGTDIAFGIIKNIESDLWATLEDTRTGESIRVRNVQVIILSR